MQKFLIALIFWVCAPASGAEVQLYVREDTRPSYVEDGVVVGKSSDILRAGEMLSCDMSVIDGKCCYEDYVGTACIDVNALVSEKPKIRDASIKSVKFSRKPIKNVCADGKSLRSQIDEFVGQYGVSLSFDEKAFVSILLRPVIDGEVINGPVLTKSEVAEPRQECVSFTLEGADIEHFITGLNKLDDVVRVEEDLNVDVAVEIQVVGPLPNEQKDELKFNTILPADSAISWPVQGSSGAK